MGDVHLSDIGNIFVLTFKDGDTVVDVSSATVTKTITFVAPDGTSTVQSATFTTDGTDGKIQYVTQAGDMDQVGQWKLQGIVVITAGTFKSEIKLFCVEANV
jgi:hypothetical protein